MISVVVPSLGGDLSKTLNSLNSGTVKPDEIIICVPNKSHSVKDLSIYKNTVVVYSEKYGQVYQRIFGFRKSKYEYIMQLDDDIYVDRYCIEELVSAMNSLKYASISPLWYNITDKDPLCYKKKSGILMSFYYWMINGSMGYAPGNISLAGTNFGVNPNYVSTDSNLVEVDWQPGGCVLHRRENLILEDYYPYGGKAYSEDLIHSHLLRKSGLSLFVASGAKCMTKLNPRLSLRGELYLDFKARLYFVKMANLSIIRMLLHYIIYIVKSIVRKNF
jgi:GT2 family glycosyltransferase